MNIAFVAPGLDPSRGGLKVVYKYATAFLSSGHKVYIIVPEGTVKERVEGIEVIEYKPVLSSFLSHQTGYFDAIIPFLKVFPKDIEVIVSAYIPQMILSIVAKKLNKCSKLIFLNMDFGEMFKFRPERKLMFWLYPKFADKLTSISSYCAAEIEKYSGCKSEVIVIGLEKEFYPRKQSDISENYIFWMGSKNKHKGFRIFIKAMKSVWQEFPDQKVKIAGGYEYLDNRLEYITIKGNLNYLAEIYTNAKLFVCSSNAEGFGLPALEAMACGCPIVTTDTGGSREYAINNENSLVVPPNNSKILSRAILKIIKNKNLSSKLTNEGIKTAKNFNWKESYKKFNQTIINT